MATPEPPYVVESKKHDYEIRNYSKVVVAETSVEASFKEAGNMAFRILAGYIFGNNQAKQKIDMTAPVSQQSQSQKIAMTAPVSQMQQDNKFLVQFTMPKDITVENAPTPLDERVKLREVPARRVAVFRYSGRWSESLYKEKLQTFLSLLQKDGIKPVSEPTFARFNAPYTLWFLRRNEIWIEI